MIHAAAIVADGGQYITPWGKVQVGAILILYIDSAGRNHQIADSCNGIPCVHCQIGENLA